MFKTGCLFWSVFIVHVCWFLNIEQWNSNFLIDFLKYGTIFCFFAQICSLFWFVTRNKFIIGYFIDLFSFVDINKHVQVLVCSQIVPFCKWKPWISFQSKNITDHK